MPTQTREAKMTKFWSVEMTVEVEGVFEAETKEEAKSLCLGDLTALVTDDCITKVSVQDVTEDWTDAPA